MEGTRTKIWSSRHRAIGLLGLALGVLAVLGQTAAAADEARFLETHFDGSNLANAPATGLTEDSVNVSACLHALEKPDNWYSILAGSGLIFNSMGDYDACTRNHSVIVHGEPISPYLMQFQPMRYCVWDGFGHDITMGWCVPEVCTQETLQAILDMNASGPPALLASGPASTVRQRLAAESEHPLGLVYCGSHARTVVDAGAAVMMVIIFLIVVLASSQCYLEHRTLSNLSEEERAFFSKDGVYENIEQPLAINSDGSKAIQVARARRQGPLAFVLKCWSFRSNISELLTTSPKRTLRCLDGLRAISMFMIILGHTYNFQLPGFVGFANAEILTHELTYWPMQFVAAAAFAVDTFFFLSGMLTAYVLVKKIDKGARAPPFFLSVVLRYLRLTPLLAFVVGCYATLYKYMGKGPLWYRFLEELDNCKDNWWTHLVYINNFVPTDFHKQCLPWAWYLADDFQYFILGMLIIWLYSKSRVAAYLVSGLMVVCGIVSIAVISFRYNIEMNNRQNMSQNYIYDKPYTRATAYGIGLLSAFYISRQMEQLKAMSNWVGHVITYVCVALICVVVFLPANFNYDKTNPNWTPNEQFAYLSVSRPIFTLAVAGLVLMCSTGHGSLMNWLLTFPFWEVFAKLTFGAYLIHPTLIRVVYYQRVQLFYYDHVEPNIFYVAFLTSSYFLAVGLYVFVEQPAANLTKALVSRKR
ncbi:uncharacterized protein MONBRDRAFT_38918 [Monosiga brevicollis MX1]|uniref:Acyltransferase 3 domain-containing protein n=1 Tax=Monosiga brevicollis TaxID=81824 RepID=A9VAY9_MONBE|nr:uncharacterized protein MONBRDRAFT_38918 [Monosiga brevicollis MX1]EDQ85299.1 predicted protein [Monosiga brevicollis MX1]|eukprot:XP_001749920.1 hypothetical protein [Monosiga brevicollis MX1]